jgi:ABC-2 type transport system permease protein
MTAMSRWAELIGGPFRASWRAGVGWTYLFIFMIVATVAFWPAFKGSSAINDALKILPPSILQAFGIQDFASPAGYLRGGLYDVIIPLMLAAAGALFANSATAAEEDAGRLELYVAQPVTRRAVMTGRTLSTAAWLLVVGLIVLLSQVLSDAFFGLDIAAAQIYSTIILCVLLGAFHAGLAICLAGFLARPGLVLSVTIGVALVGYVVFALFPLSDVLKPFAAISPWDWAFRSDPLVNGAELWRYVALAIPSVVLAVIGILAFERRDVRSA